jgi:hypothetical protein
MSVDKSAGAALLALALTGDLDAVEVFVAGSDDPAGLAAGVAVAAREVFALLAVVPGEPDLFSAQEAVEHARWLILDK